MRNKMVSTFLKPSWAQCDKKIYGLNLQITSICPGQALPAYVVKVGSLPYSGASKWCFTWVDSCLARKHQTGWKDLPRMISLVNYEHS